MQEDTACPCLNQEISWAGGRKLGAGRTCLQLPSRAVLGLGWHPSASPLCSN